MVDMSNMDWTVQGQFYEDYFNTYIEKKFTDLRIWKTLQMNHVAYKYWKL